VASVVRVVIPDSGVLISLAKAELLDLLLVFRDNVEIVITDVVEFEVTRRLDKTDANVIRRFLTRHQARVRVEATGFAGLLAKARRSGTDDLPPDVGELSIYSFVRNMRPDPGPPTLVLFEDDFFISNAVSARPGNIHLLSTRAFIHGLEKLAPKFPANVALQRILKHRPTVQAAIVDEPAPRIPQSSSWEPAIDEVKVARVGKRLR